MPRLTFLKVRKGLCEECHSEAVNPSCTSCRLPLVAKRIPLFATSLIEINEDVVARLLEKGLTDAAVSYYERQTERDGDIFIMRRHETNLRHLINSRRELTEHDWMVIILGLCIRLQNAAAYGLVHGDLKPSNGTGHYTIFPDIQSYSTPPREARLNLPAFILATSAFISLSPRNLRSLAGVRSSLDIYLMSLQRYSREG